MCSGFYQYQTEQSRRMVLLKSKMPDLAPFPAALECDFVIEEPGNCFWQLGVTWSRSSQREAAEPTWVARP